MNTILLIVASMLALLVSGIFVWRFASVKIGFAMIMTSAISFVAFMITAFFGGFDKLVNG